jgi:M6 family metalloprotease-like protein
MKSSAKEGSRVVSWSMAGWLCVLFLAWALPAFASAPDPPTIGLASAANGRATVTFTAPASDGGSAITGYTVTSHPAGGVDSNAGSPGTRHIVTGLSNGTAYTFTVTAANLDGSSAASAASNSISARPYAPTTGTINNIVVFIRFSDQPEFSQPTSYYDSLFNSSPNSLKNFYLENSYNTLTVNSTFYPASGASIVSYQDSHATSYYQPYDAVNNPTGYQGAQSSARETALVTNALNAISAQLAAAGVNFDGDGDGYLDHICFEVYSTDANPLPVLFYSRASYDYSGGIVVNGLKVGAYTWVTASQDYPELTSPAIHEMGHSFGYPDLRNNGTRTPVGIWDVMSISTPGTDNGAYEKYQFTNWITDLPEITSYGSYTLNDITQSTNNSYRIKLADSEFLVLEYRKAAGPFESNIHSSGLCITRVNTSVGMWGNLGGPPFFLYYFRPGGTVANDGSASNSFACLNAESGRTQFNDYSNPACFLSDGTPCGISIYNIGNTSGSSISFSVGDPSATVVTHLISGYLSYSNGSRVSGATVTLSGGATGTVTTGNLGTYLFTVNDGGSYTVTPSKANVTFNPTSVTFNNLTSDKIQNIPATNNTNTISGKVASAGSPLSGIPVYLSCSAGINYSSPQTTDSAGNFSFTVTAGGDCQVYPVKSNYFFTPSSKTFSNLTADQVQNFDTSTATVNLTGTITNNGIPLSGVTVDCPGASTATPVTTNSSGNYSFSVSIGNGTVYTVTPSSSSYSFSPSSRSFSGIVGSQVQNFSTLPGSSTVLSSSANPAVSGQSVTFTAAVSGTTPTGSVTFNDGASPLCAAVPLANGEAQCAAGALATGSHSIIAVYSGDGSNGASSSSPLIQSMITLPGAPTGVSASAGVGEATVTFSAPVSNGGSPITGYTVVSIPAGGTDSNAGSTALSHLVTGLSNGTPYIFKVTASNLAGTGSASGGSPTVIPLALPTVSATPLTSGIVGASYTGFVINTAGATDVTVSNLPPGISLTKLKDPNSGQVTYATIDGVPTAAGSYGNIVITASNGAGSTSLPAFAIAVKQAPPTIAGVPATVGMVGFPFSTLAPAVTNATSFGISGTLPPGLAFDTGTGIISGTPTVSGIYPNLAISAANSDWSAALPSFAITISPRIDAFSVTQPLATARQHHSSTLLGSGKVLVTGGDANSSNYLASAELYDPVTGTWSPAGSMSVARSYHSATLLRNGQVLVAGGNGDSGPLDSAEIYDPSSNSWITAGGSVMGSTHFAHTATLLGDGTVLVAGGLDPDFGAITTVEIYTPSSNSWRTVTPMPHLRFGNSATLVTGGKVLFAGGSAVEGAELYDPVSDSWSSAGAMQIPRGWHTATALLDGKVLVAGGSDFVNSPNSYSSSAELYDPVSNSWSAVGPMNVGRQSHSATLLKDGTVLVTGGEYTSNGTLASAEIFDPGKSAWAIAGSMAAGRAGHADTILDDGNVVLVGGWDGTNPIARVEVYDYLHPQSIGPITFTPGTMAVGGTTTVTATASSGLGVVFSSMTPGTCTVSGNTVTGIAAGTCTMAADQPGDASHSSAPQMTKNFSVGQGSQQIGVLTFTPLVVAVGGATTVSATATSGLGVVFTSTTPSVCTVSGSTVTGIAAGTCTVAASQPGNANYSAAPGMTQTITIAPGAQSIGAISFAPAAISVGGATTVSATASSGLAVVFTSTTPALCTVNGSTVTGIAAGTCTVAASQSGNANYSAAPGMTQTISIAPGAQSIGAISFAPATISVGGATTVSATASSGLAVVFTSTTPAVCTVNGSTVTGIAAGTCTVAASQPGNANYSAAPGMTQTVSIAPGAQSIGAISFAPATISVGGATTVSATATSGLAVVFTSTTPAVCTVNGSTVTGIAAGTCTVAASQSGNADYSAAPGLTQSITIAPRPVNGTCGSSNSQTLAAAPSVNLCAAGSPSAVTGAGPWNWSCDGINGGSTITCSAGLVLGDMNGDGVVDVADAMIALKIAVGLFSPTPGDYARGDVGPLKDGKASPDGVIDISDVMLILKKAVQSVSY